jgi:HPt (histidine-containing phosphotransfer) domain-containing protein
MLQEIVQLFCAEAPELLARIQTAIAHGDGRALVRAAHSLKGTVMSFGARPAGEAALRLEVMGRGGDLTQARVACAELEREVAQLGNALAVFREEQVA